MNTSRPLIQAIAHVRLHDVYPNPRTVLLGLGIDAYRARTESLGKTPQECAAAGAIIVDAHLDAVSRVLTKIGDGRVTRAIAEAPDPVLDWWCRTHFDPILSEAPYP